MALNILVVDDSAVMRAMVVKSLRAPLADADQARASVSMGLEEGRAEIFFFMDKTDLQHA